MAFTQHQAMEKAPLMAPPAGVIPNFSNPETRAGHINACSGVCMFIILLFAALRLCAKTFILKKTWDDLISTLGIIAGITYLSLGLAVVNVKHAFGIHQWDLTFEDMPAKLLLLSNVLQMSYGPLFWLVKLSLFVLFIQIFRPFRWVRYCCWIGAVVTGLFYFAKLIVYASLCLPSVHGDHTALGYVKAWASPQCKNLTELMLATGAVNVVSDLYLMILPLPAVWQLNLPRKRKIGISFMFLTGAVACLASVLSLQNRIELAHGYTGDITWNAVPAMIYANVEITAGIAVSCMPATAAVFNHFKPTIRSLLSSTASSLGLKRSSVRCTLTSLTPRRFHTGTNGAKAGCPKLPSVCQSARPFVVDGLASEEGRGDWRELAKIGEGKAMGQDRGLVVIEVEKVGERDADGGDSV